MQLIVLASGRGSRLENYTNNKPKCLVEVRDKPIISYLKPAFKLYKEVIIITGYKSNVLQNYLKKLLNVNTLKREAYEHSYFWDGIKSETYYPLNTCAEEEREIKE